MYKIGTRLKLKVNPEIEGEITGITYSPDGNIYAVKYDLEGFLCPGGDEKFLDRVFDVINEKVN